MLATTDVRSSRLIFSRPPVKRGREKATGQNTARYQAGNSDDAQLIAEIENGSRLHERNQRADRP
jgi:hypothetical protein